MVVYWTETSHFTELKGTHNQLDLDFPIYQLHFMVNRNTNMYNELS